jgi:hypothetical protein
MIGISMAVTIVMRSYFDAHEPRHADERRDGKHV